MADKGRADLEWRRQCLEESAELTPDEPFNGSFKYPNLRKVVACVMSLPFPNASVERLFSLLTLVKSDVRNALKRETLAGLMHAHEGMKASGVHAHEIICSSGEKCEE